MRRLLLACVVMISVTSTIINIRDIMKIVSNAQAQPSPPHSAKGQGTATTTSNTAVTLIPGVAGKKIFITGIHCFDTNATTPVTVTFSDLETSGTGTQMFVPANNSSTYSFTTPLETAPGSAFSFTPSASVTTVGCNAQGYYQ